uniref:Bcl-2-like protein 2 transcript variant 15 n=1 Tax=Sus scrofa TaxID=9823 RepID=A0A7T8CLX0_PIG|nr:bcl-2-like protein 2 transcript variant 15 [Sus scrofa]
MATPASAPEAEAEGLCLWSWPRGGPSS